MHLAAGERGPVIIGAHELLPLSRPLSPQVDSRGCGSERWAFNARKPDAMTQSMDVALQAFAPALPLAVALSGGADSTALLLACARRWPGQVLAIHVHHGLQAAADGFEHARFKGTAKRHRMEGGAGFACLVLGFQPRGERLRVRTSRGDDAIAAAEAALTHFEAVNLDLMYALPGQSLAEAEADLAMAIALAPQHLSCYHLTLEPNTAFAANPPTIPDPDASADMQDLVEARLAGAGYGHYETSAFARPNRECRHNLNYWTFGDYLGIGAGAHGKLSSHEGIVRETRPRHPSAYLAARESGTFVQERRTIESAELPFEFMMNALRLNQGFPRRLFAERTGLPFEAAEAGLLKATRQGLIETNGESLRPTTQGRHFLNELLMLFLPG